MTTKRLRHQNSMVLTLNHSRWYLLTCALVRGIVWIGKRLSRSLVSNVNIISLLYCLCVGTFWKHWVHQIMRKCLQPRVDNWMIPYDFFLTATAPLAKNCVHKSSGRFALNYQMLPRHVTLHQNTIKFRRKIH